MNNYYFIQTLQKKCTERGFFSYNSFLNTIKSHSKSLNDSNTKNTATKLTNMFKTNSTVI